MTLNGMQPFDCFSRDLHLQSCAIHPAAITVPTKNHGGVEAMKEKKRSTTDGEQIQWKRPFAALGKITLPPTTAEQPSAPHTEPAAKKNRGRVDIIRQTAHRGGKTVTVVTGFVGISQAEKEKLAKSIQTACGAGGTVKEGRIEIQGDRRELIARILADAGFRPVFAGG